MEFVKKIVSTILCAAVLLAVGVTLVGCGSATTPAAPTTKPGTTAASTDKTIEGKFVSYDKDKDKMVLKVKDKDEDFNVKGITPTSDGKDIKYDDIKKDDKITVITTKDDKVTKVEKAK